MAANMNKKTLTGAGDLIRILPTGTVFLFQFLSPIITNTGQCHPIHKTLSFIFILLCGLSCIISSFTDSYVAHNGVVRWGFATPRGMWLAPASASEVAPMDLSAYALRPGDFVHATLSALVFAVLVVLDTDTVRCFFPDLVAEDRKVLVQALPTVVGAISGAVFVMLPNTRHGIGYHSSAR